MIMIVGVNGGGKTTSLGEAKKQCLSCYRVKGVKIWEWGCVDYLNWRNFYLNKLMSDVLL